MKTIEQAAAYEAVKNELLSALKDNLTISVDCHREVDYGTTSNSITVSIYFDGSFISDSTTAID